MIFLLTRNLRFSSFMWLSILLLVCLVHASWHIHDNNSVIQMLVNDKLKACRVDNCWLICNDDHTEANLCSILNVPPTSKCLFQDCDLVCNSSVVKKLCTKSYLKGSRQLSLNIPLSRRKLGATIATTRDNRNSHDESNPFPIWPHRRLCYKIAPLVNATAVLTAIDHWREKTNLSFVECLENDENHGGDSDGGGGGDDDDDDVSHNATAPRRRHPQCCPPCGDFIHFQPSDHYHSPIGYVPHLCEKGGQPLGVPASSIVGNIIHEIGHAVGLVHEHQRACRDHYVKIYLDNVVKQYWPDFAKGVLYLMDGGRQSAPYTKHIVDIKESDDHDDHDDCRTSSGQDGGNCIHHHHNQEDSLNIDHDDYDVNDDDRDSRLHCDDYDYHSIMHYGMFAFSDNKNQQTIMPISGPEGTWRMDLALQIGQRRGLSDGDIAFVERMYHRTTSR